MTTRSATRYSKRVTGERLRPDSPHLKAARAGTAERVATQPHLQVKEVGVDADGRLLVCVNSEQAEHDALIRRQVVAELESAILESDKLTPARRTQLADRMSTAAKRYLRITPSGLLRIDRQQVASEASLDGTFLLHTDDPTLTAADTAVGYAAHLALTRAWEYTQRTIDLCPSCYRPEPRMSAHAIVCWLALLLIRVAELRTGRTWSSLCRELSDLQRGTFLGPAGAFSQRTEISLDQAQILTALALPEPPRVSGIDPSS